MKIMGDTLRYGMGTTSMTRSEVILPNKRAQSDPHSPRDPQRTYEAQDYPRHYDPYY